MHELVISDTSCLIVLENIDEIELLHLVYGSITITPEISEEFNSKIPEWIRIQPVNDKKYLEFLLTQVDNGEASVLALAKEHNSSLLLLDDLKARKLAFKLKLKYTGTLGLIHKAKQLGHITKVKPILQKLMNSGFRISGQTIDDLLRLNNED